jgi:ubiquinone biosynthesis protein UbiJ
LALTNAQIGEAAGNGSFMMKLQGALQKHINTVLTEDESTNHYVVRRKFAQRVGLNLSGFAVAMAVSVASVLPGTVSDLNTVTDTEINNAVIAVFTETAYAHILPS